MDNPQTSASLSPERPHNRMAHLIGKPSLSHNQQSLLVHEKELEAREAAMARVREMVDQPLQAFVAITVKADGTSDLYVRGSNSVLRALANAFRDYTHMTDAELNELVEGLDDNDSDK